MDDGQVFDSSIERGEPLEFTMWQGQLTHGFEQGVIDLKVNEKKTIHISKADAYGELRKELVQEVPKNQLPEDIEPEIGKGPTSQAQEGRDIDLIVTHVKEDSITVDGKHPLAGKDLTFELEVLEVL